ncbi:hypothetical protein D9M70_453780 [compost metagenome]
MQGVEHEQEQDRRRVDEERLRPEDVEQEGRKKRPDDRAERPEEQHAGRYQRMLPLGCVVVGMRRAERIERHGKSADEEDAGKVQPFVVAGAEDQEQAGEQRAEGGDQDDQPAVDPVGIMAERILQHDAADDAGAHEGGDRRH